MTVGLSLADLVMGASWASTIALCRPERIPSSQLRLRICADGLLEGLSRERIERRALLCLFVIGGDGARAAGRSKPTCEAVLLKGL